MAAKIDWRAFAYQIKLKRQAWGNPSIRAVAKTLALSSSTVQRACAGEHIPLIAFLVVCKQYINVDPRIFLKL